MKTKIYFAIVSAAVLLLSCGGEFKKFYVIDVPRVAVAQVMNVPGNDLSACAAYPYCLQFPARPAQAAQIRFVALSPKSEAVELSITSVVSQKADLVAGSSRSNLGGAAQDAYCDEADATLTLTKNATLSSVKQDTPMRIEEFVYDVTPVAWSQLLQAMLTKKCSPIFRINYKAKSASGDDKGFLNVFMLPDPTDTTSWDEAVTAATQAGLPAAAAAEMVEQYKVLAKTNLPPKIDELTPSDGQTIKRGENKLKIAFDKSADTDENARMRVGWFVSHGELNFKNRTSVKWEPDHKGEVSAFVMVRDLQGAVVYKFGKYTAQ